MWAILPGSSLEHAADSTSEGGEADSPAPIPSEDSADDAPQPQQREEHPRRRSSGAWRSFLRPESPKLRRASVRFCCYLCGDETHGAASCPDDICICCLRVGHQMKECPSGRRPVVCSGCGRLGHFQRDCTASSERVSLELVRCLACGEYGHVDCTPHEPRPKRISCFNCGLTGHNGTGCSKDGSDRWSRLFSAAANSVVSGPPAAWGHVSGGGRAGGGRGRAWGGGESNDWIGWGGRGLTRGSSKGGRGASQGGGKGRGNGHTVSKGATKGGVQGGGIWKRAHSMRSHMRWG